MKKETQNKIQLEKIQVMQAIIEQMEKDFFNPESTSEFLKRTKESINSIIIKDF